MSIINHKGKIMNLKNSSAKIVGVYINNVTFDDTDGANLFKLKDSSIFMMLSFLSEIHYVGPKAVQVSIIYGRKSQIETRKVNVTDIDSRFIVSLSSQMLINQTRIENITRPDLFGVGLYAENSQVQVDFSHF